MRSLRELSLSRELLMSMTLLGSGLALAAGPSPVASSLSPDAPVAIAQAQSQSDDEDEDDPAPASTGTQPSTPAATAPASTPATPAPSASTSAEVTDQQKLVSGAPLYNPNVAVHIVEQKTYSDSKKVEVVLFPAAMQINGKFTQHFGTFGSVVYHLQENFGIQLTGGGNWYNVESAFNGELVQKFRIEAQAATSLLWVWGVLAGVEATPIYGKFAFFEGTLAHFSFVLNGGVGAGGTRHQLKPESVDSSGNLNPATYGDTGVRFMGSIGAGFRLRLGERVAFRLEVRDVVYAARMESINGCNASDLRVLDQATRMGQEPIALQNDARLTASCRLEDFSGTDDNGNLRRNDVPLAYNLVRNPTSDVLNNVGLYLGVSFLF